MYQNLVLALLVFMFASVGHAQEDTKASGETSVKIEEVHKEAEQSVKKSSENDEADQVITNKKLRAETGSLSKWSISTTFDYFGGTIEKPGDAVRPDLTASGDQPTLASMYGSVGVKYRTSKLTSLTLGIGLSMVTPFNESTKSDDEGINSYFKSSDDKLQASNPSLSFSVLNKIGGVQSVTQIVNSWYTEDFFRDRGNLTSLDFSQTFAYDIGASGLSIGMTFLGGYGFFDKPKNARLKGGKESIGTLRSNYNIGAYPFVEYVINDTFNIRTTSNVWAYRHVDAETNAWTFKKTPIYQSIGVGISVARDVYLYPNVQFLPENIRSDMTNVAVSSNFNIF